MRVRSLVNDLADVQQQLQAMNAGVLNGAMVWRKLTVDCSGGGSGIRQDLFVIPAGTLLYDVLCVATEAFDGDTDAKFYVGLGSGFDSHYIDGTTDWDPAVDKYASMRGGTNNTQQTPEWIDTETTLKTYWNNYHNPTTGKVDVYVLLSNWTF